MLAADLPAVERIGEIVHPAYPEAAAVPAERLSLFPAGCFIAEGPEILGYAVSHPGILGVPPVLDSLLGGLPAVADCLYLHDVALLPAARGRGLGRMLVDRLLGLAAARSLPCLALVAVNRSVPYWTRLGFQPPEGASDRLRAKLASYGGDAAYLVRPV
ncbi:N-acetyltransferase GCN5 [Allostella humosa]|nr:GNAT family N-acetyltransferase [Stella humosa]BBK34698.1 N-acetyltransferase GCN5 [Stella humosa]